MIHQYQNNGYNIVLDVNSGSVHVVDQVGYDVIANERYRYDGYGIFTTRLSGGLMIADHVMLGVTYKLQVKDNHACHGIGASLSYRF